jgi:hypothetical protein
MGGSVSLEILGAEPVLERARRTMEPGAYERASADGRALSTDQAVELALSE